MSPEEREKIMKGWDHWRGQIADGCTGSAPRDWFESILDYFIYEYCPEKVKEQGVEAQMLSPLIDQFH